MIEQELITTFSESTFTGIGGIFGATLGYVTGLIIEKIFQDPKLREDKSNVDINSLETGALAVKFALTVVGTMIGSSIGYSLTQSP